MEEVSYTFLDENKQYPIKLKIEDKDIKINIIDAENYQAGSIEAEIEIEGVFFKVGFNQNGLFCDHEIKTSHKEKLYDMLNNYYNSIYPKNFLPSGSFLISETIMFDGSKIHFIDSIKNECVIETNDCLMWCSFENQNFYFTGPLFNIPNCVSIVENIKTKFEK